jgi:hypothetical protein
LGMKKGLSKTGGGSENTKIEEHQTKRAHKIFVPRVFFKFLVQKAISSSSSSSFIHSFILVYRGASAVAGSRGVGPHGTRLAAARFAPTRVRARRARGTAAGLGAGVLPVGAARAGGHVQARCQGAVLSRGARVARFRALRACVASPRAPRAGPRSGDSRKLSGGASGAAAEEPAPGGTVVANPVLP